MFLRVLWIVTLLLTLGLNLRVYLFVLPCSFTPAPFRLLAFADPQLEGDTSVWHAPPDAAFRPTVFWRRVRDGDMGILWAAGTSLRTALPHYVQSLRKRIDLMGNDAYLAHIYRSMQWWAGPTHVTVLGDLLGSQWIGDDEFERRAARFWRIFRGERVDDALTTSSLHDPAWRHRIINIAGNHDVGYAGDLTPARLGRFERAFGRANYQLTFHADNATLRLVILNSMNLDTPARSRELQDDTYAFINGALAPHDGTGTIVLTHIPLYKEAGVCVDGPFVAYHDGGIKEQNHLSYDAGPAILDGLLGGHGLVLNGHDHEGCDVDHVKTDGRWIATAHGGAGIREVTCRSMMGEFGGYAYMVSAWHDTEWHFAVDRCAAGVQHWWWAAHIMLLVSLAWSGGVVAGVV